MRKVTSRGEEIYNSDVFDVLVQYEVSRSKRYPTPMALLQIEMTSSASNEEAQQAAPAIFTTTLNTHLRSVDVPSVVGNSFRILLPTTNETGLRSVCERLLSVFKNKFNTPNGSSIAFSLNIGATSHIGGPTLSTEGIFQKADEALKQSKLKGANTFVVISE